MSTAPASTATRRPVPLWYALVWLAIAALWLLGWVVSLRTSDGAGRLVALVATLAGALGLVVVVVVVALLRKRRRRSLEPVEGVLSIGSSPVLAACLVGLLLLLPVAAVLLLVIRFTDPAALEGNPRFWYVVVGGVLVLPWVVRLLSGRMHRWRLVLGPDELTYQGFRDAVTLPWSKIHGARISGGREAGVLIDRKGQGADVLVPTTAFSVPGEQIVEEIERFLSAARR